MRAGDVIPQVVSPKLPRKNKSARKPKPPKKCPRLRHRDGQARGRRLHDLPQPRRLPRPVLPARQALRQQGGDGHRRAGREAGAALPRGGADRRRRRHLRPRRGAAGRRSEGFGEISARNLVAAIDASRERPFKRVLYALGLPGVGYVTAEALADHFGSIDALHEADPEQIEEVEGVGPIMAVQIAESLADERDLELVEKLRREGPAAGADPSERRASGRPAGGQDRGPHRHPAGADPRGGGGAGQGAPAARSSTRSRRKPTTSSPARARARSWPRPRSSGPRSSTKPACWRCSAEPLSRPATAAGDPVLLEVGEAEVADAVHQDREDHDPAARVEAVAGEVADPGEGAGLGPAAAVGGGAVHAVGDRALVAGQGEVLDEFVAGRGRRASPAAGRTTCRGEARLERVRPEPSTAWTPEPCAAGEVLDHRGAGRGGAGAAEVGRRAA